MSYRNPDWYVLNETRSYPVDDSATAIDDRGQVLDHTCIADLHLLFPRTLGDYAFLSALTVTPKVVTVLILGQSNNLFVPIASFSKSQPLEQGRQYVLTGMSKGVGGWIVFGSGLAKEKIRSYRFSSRDQSLLALNAARRYKPFPVQSLGILNSDAVTLGGLVRLKSGNDVKIVKETRELFGVERDVIVFRLADTLGEDTTRNVDSIYAGPCGRRPETGNCNELGPITQINEVKPDCCGNIMIELRGCADFAALADECGVAVSCDFAVADTCITPDRLPTADGKLPNEFTDECVSFSESLGGVEETSSAVPSLSDSASIPGHDESSSIHLLSLPFYENFDDQSAPAFEVVSGDFVFVQDDPPVEAAARDASSSTGGDYSWSTEGERSLSLRNVALWNSGIPDQFEWSTLFKQVETSFKLQLAPAGGLHNGGIVINYRTASANAALNVFWTAEVDWDGSFGDGAKRLLIRRYNGTSFITESSVEISKLALEAWVRLTVRLYGNAGTDGTFMRVHLEDLTYKDFDAQIGPIFLTNYMPADGFYGLTSLRAHTRFAYFLADNKF